MGTLAAKLNALQHVVLLATGLATLAGWLAKWHWLLELFSHFRLQYIIILFAAALVYGLQRLWAGAFVALTLCGLNVPPVVSVFLPRDSVTIDHGFPLVLLSANLNSRNTDTDAILDMVRTEQPDVLVVQEFTFRWAKELAGLEETFAYHFQHPQEDNFGLALFSRWPLTDAESFPLGGSTTALNAQVATSNGPIQIIAVHLRPPMTSGWAAERAAQFQQLTELAAASELPLVVVGDFNATPWSPGFRAWAGASQLQNGLARGGLAYTWPVALPVFWIPIDACVVNTDLLVTDQRRSGPVGSDHYPLVTTIRPKTQ